MIADVFMLIIVNFLSVIMLYYICVNIRLFILIIVISTYCHRLHISATLCAWQSNYFCYQIVSVSRWVSSHATLGVIHFMSWNVSGRVCREGVTRVRNIALCIVTPHSGHVRLLAHWLANNILRRQWFPGISTKSVVEAVGGMPSGAHRHVLKIRRLKNSDSLKNVCIKMT